MWILLMPNDFAGLYDPMWMRKKNFKTPKRRLFFYEYTRTISSLRAKCEHGPKERHSK